ncbi:MAG: chorismate mutase [Lachnospiraceae bacterium]|nr:chorismate mutase [Lachnospiraceae bacterium]
MDLNKIRQDIDRVDSSIKPLFIERMACGKNVALAKAESKGNVYVPEREQQVVANRAKDVSLDIHDEYVAFLLHLMSLCRRYEYGILTDMQEETLADALAKTDYSIQTPHNKVAVAFDTREDAGSIQLVMNMIALNSIRIEQLSLNSEGPVSHINCTLLGNVNEKNMKLLLCQLAKETQDFKIKELI